MSSVPRQHHDPFGPLASTGTAATITGTYQVSLRIHDEPFSSESLLISDRLLPKLQVGELVALWPLDPKAPATLHAPVPAPLSSASLSKFPHPSHAHPLHAHAHSVAVSSPPPPFSPSPAAAASPLRDPALLSPSDPPDLPPRLSSASMAAMRPSLRTSSPALPVPNRPLPNTALVFRVSEQTLRTGINFDLSLGDRVAKQFNLAVRTDMYVRRASEEEAKLDAVELVFKDQYICRSDMWQLQRALVQRCVFSGESLIIGEIRAQVRKATHLGHSNRADCQSLTVLGNDYARASGLIDDRTRFVFRSRSARFYVLLQISRDSFEFAADGYQYIEKMMDWCKIFLERWNAQKVTHTLSVIFFARCFFPSSSPFSPAAQPPASRDPDAKLDSLNRPYRDYFQTAVRDESASDWLSLLPTIRTQLARFIAVLPATPARPLAASPETASFARASDGNLLEAINLALDVLEEDHLDKDITKTGQEIVIVSPSTGVFNVPHPLIKITKSRMIANGIGCDLICLTPPPLHVVPLFRYGERTLIASKGAASTTASSASMIAPTNPTMVNLSSSSSSSSSFNSEQSSPISSVASGSSSHTVLVEKFSFPYWIYLCYFPSEAVPPPPSTLIPVYSTLYQQWTEKVFQQRINAPHARSSSLLIPAQPFRYEFSTSHHHSSSSQTKSSSSSSLSSSTTTTSILSHSMELLQSPRIDTAGVLRWTEEMMDKYDDWIFEPQAELVFLPTKEAPQRPTPSKATGATGGSIDIPILSFDEIPPIDGAASYNRHPSLNKRPAHAASSQYRLQFADPSLHEAASYAVRIFIAPPTSTNLPPGTSPPSATSASGSSRMSINPFMPYSPNYSRESSGRGRFAHVFPEGYSPYLRKRHELYLSTHNWTSLVEPAALPLTSSYFPSDASLRLSFQVYNHCVVPLNEGGQSTLPELLDQLVAQRLEQGYQLVATRPEASETDGNGQEPRSRSVAGSQLVSPSPVALAAMKGKRLKAKTIPIYRLSLSDNFHALVFDVENQQIVVKQYRPQQNFLSSISGSAPMVYDYSIYNITKQEWHRKKMANRWTEAAQTVGWYNWSYVDQLVCGYEDDLSSIPKYWRIRLVLLPTLPLSAVSCTNAVQSFNRFMAEISRYSSSKGEEAPVKIVMPPEFKDSLDGGEQEIHLHTPRIRGNRNRLRTYQLREIVQLMQDPQQGVSVKTRRYGMLRFYRDCFLGSEAVSWMVENIDVGDLLALTPDGTPAAGHADDDDLQRLRAGAQNFGQQLMQNELIAHVAKKSEFIDAPFFYRFVGSSASVPANLAGAPETHEPAPEERVASPVEKDQTRAEVYKAKINVSGAQRDSHNPYQWILMHYDSVYSPLWPFSIEIHWLVSTGCEVSKFLNRLHRAAKMQRMTFIQVPINQYVENDPFRAPSIFLLSESKKSRYEIEHYLTENLQFIQNLRPNFQFVRPGSDQVEYVHTKGAAFILLDSDYLAMNLNYTSRSLISIGRELRNEVARYWAVEKHPDSPIREPILTDTSPTPANVPSPLPPTPTPTLSSPLDEVVDTMLPEIVTRAGTPSISLDDEIDRKNTQVIDEHRLRRVFYYLTLKQIYYR